MAREKTEFRRSSPFTMQVFLQQIARHMGVALPEFRANDPDDVQRGRVLLLLAMELTEAWQNALLAAEPRDRGLLVQTYVQAPEVLTCMRLLGQEPSPELLLALESLGYGDPGPLVVEVPVPDEEQPTFSESVDAWLDDTAQNIVQALGNPNAGYTEEFLQACLQAEEAGKARATVLRALNTALGN